MNTLKEELASALRHAVTALAAIGTLLAMRGCIAAEDEAAVNAAGGTIGEALVVIVAAIVARVAISWMGRIKALAQSGRNAPVLIWATLPLLFGFVVAGSLTSCAEYSGPRFVLGLDSEQARVEYDSAKGGTVKVEAKVPAIQATK